MKKCPTCSMMSLRQRNVTGDPNWYCSYCENSFTEDKLNEMGYDMEDYNEYNEYKNKTD